MKIPGIAHRGYPVKYPENTLSSFKAACDLSFSHVELDTHLSRDGIPVIMHDPTVNRTTNGTGYIKDYTLAELKQLTVGDQETIPTLKEALAFLKGKTTAMLELKKVSDFYPMLEKKVFEVIKKLGMIDSVIISSFNHYALKNMRTLSQDIELSVLMGGISPAVIPFMKSIGARYMSIPQIYLVDDIVNKCKQHDIQLITRPMDVEKNMMKTLQYPDVLVSTNELERWKVFYESHHYG